MKMSDLKSAIKKFTRLELDRKFIVSLRDKLTQTIRVYPALKWERMDIRNRFAQRLAWTMSVIFFFGGAGMVLGASDALPGERLYAVKLAIESVQERFATAPEAKAELHLRMAQKRLAEVQQVAALLSNGEGNHQNVQIALDNFKRHIQEAQGKVQDLAASGNAEAASVAEKVERAAAHQSSQLATLRSQLPGESGKGVAATEQATLDVQKEVVKVEAAVSKTSETTEARAKEKFTQFELKIEAVRRRIQQLEVEAGRDATAEASFIALQAEKKFLEAQREFRDKKFLYAFVSAQDALKLAISADVALGEELLARELEEREKNQIRDTLLPVETQEQPPAEVPAN